MDSALKTFQQVQTEIEDKERDEGIERLRTQRDELDSLLVRYRQEDASLDPRLERDRIQLTAHQQQLEQQSPVQVLAKAITNEALWN